MSFVRSPAVTTAAIRDVSVRKEPIRSKRSLGHDK
jgi:hypothetical protein